MRPGCFDGGLDLSAACEDVLSSLRLYYAWEDFFCGESFYCPN